MSHALSTTRNRVIALLLAIFTMLGLGMVSAPAAEAAPFSALCNSRMSTDNAYVYYYRNNQSYGISALNRGQCVYGNGLYVMMVPKYGQPNVTYTDWGTFRLTSNKVFPAHLNKTYTVTVGF